MPVATIDPAQGLVAGLVVMQSWHGPRTTGDRFVAGLAARRIPLLARIDHAAGASVAGMILRPTELFLFGQARIGTPLMQLVQTAAIDLPLRALVWQDAADRTWLGHVDPRWIAERHRIGPAAETSLNQMSQIIAVIAADAVA